jgi:ribonuclease HI
MDEIKKNTLSVDAGYSSKTGVMDYRGVWTDTGEVWFEKVYSVGTNNIGEFLAIVHALAQMKKEGMNNPVYTDSNTAIAWVRKKAVNTKLELNENTNSLWKVIRRAEQWLKDNEYENEILKWHTSEWGEIKADYDRK